MGATCRCRAFLLNLNGMKAYRKVLLSMHRRIDKHERDIQFFDPENAGVLIANAKAAAFDTTMDYEYHLGRIVEQLRQSNRSK